MTARRLAAAALAMAAGAVALTPRPGATLPVRQPGPGSAGEGIYTEAQAERGAALYAEQCVDCHGAVTQLMPEMAALLADHTFRARWRTRSLGELFELIQVEMPQDAPGSLTAPETAALVAYILQGNARPPGSAPLPDDLSVLGAIPFDPDPD